MIPRLGGVTLSVLLHAGLLGVLLAWSAADWTRPLFVDLTEPPEPAGAAATGPLAPSPQPAARAARAGSAAGVIEPRREPLAPTTPSARPPAPVSPAVEPAVPVAPPPPAVAVEPAPPLAPAVAPPPSLPAPPVSASVADGRSGAPEASAGPVARSPVLRGHGESGPGGATGSPLALATPGAGGASGVSAEYGPYLRRFRQRVAESLIYPLAARRQGLAGTVELHVWLEPTGRVRDVQIARSSSHDVLDDAAIETIRRLGAVPFPDSVPRRPLLIRIPLVYELR